MADSKRPAEAGRPVVIALQAYHPNRTGEKTQDYATREAALARAHDLSRDANRYRQESRFDQTPSGRALGFLACHYAGLARLSFQQAYGPSQSGSAPQ